MGIPGCTISTNVHEVLYICKPYMTIGFAPTINEKDYANNKIQFTKTADWKFEIAHLLPQNGSKSIE